MRNKRQAAQSPALEVVYPLNITESVGRHGDTWTRSSLAIFANEDGLLKFSVVGNLYHTNKAGIRYARGTKHQLLIDLAKPSIVEHINRRFFGRSTAWVDHTVENFIRILTNNHYDLSDILNTVDYMANAQYRKKDWWNGSVPATVSRAFGAQTGEMAVNCHKAWCSISSERSLRAVKEFVKKHGFSSSKRDSFIPALQSMGVEITPTMPSYEISIRIINVWLKRRTQNLKFKPNYFENIYDYQTWKNSGYRKFENEWAYDVSQREAYANRDYAYEWAYQMSGQKAFTLLDFPVVMPDEGDTFQVAYNRQQALEYGYITRAEYDAWYGRDYPEPEPVQYHDLDGSEAEKDQQYSTIPDFATYCRESTLIDQCCPWCGKFVSETHNGTPCDTCGDEYPF
jgi:hypothetical protein